MIYSYKYDTEIGTITLSESNGSILELSFKEIEFSDNYIIQETILLRNASIELKEYFSGYRKDFSLPFNPIGTPFQKKVWEALLSIPYGETRSYKDIAFLIGNPKASRAVGMANNKNPISIFIPCHRVIGSNGKLVGYGGGLNVKKHLLNLESNNI